MAPQIVRAGMGSFASLRMTVPVNLDIAVSAEPFYGAAEGIVGGDDFPSEFALGFVGSGPHFFLAHAHGFDGGAGLAAEQSAGDGFIDGSSDVGDEVWKFHGGRGQAGDCAELVQNFFQREVFAAEYISFAASAFFERGDMATGA